MYIYQSFTHGIHVWYIYLRLGDFLAYMDPIRLDIPFQIPRELSVIRIPLLN